MHIFNRPEPIPFATIKKSLAETPSRFGIQPAARHLKVDPSASSIRVLIALNLSYLEKSA